MLPKIDSPEWTQCWNLETKINALNDAIQSLSESLDGLISTLVSQEIKDAGEDGKKAKSTSDKKRSNR